MNDRGKRNILEYVLDELISEPIFTAFMFYLMALTAFTSFFDPYKFVTYATVGVFFVVLAFAIYFAYHKHPTAYVAFVFGVSQLAVSAYALYDYFHPEKIFGVKRLELFESTSDYAFLQEGIIYLLLAVGTVFFAIAIKNYINDRSEYNNQKN